MPDRGGLRVIFTCLAVDAEHPVLSHVCEWISTLAERPEISGIEVISTSVGRYDLPANVRVHPIRAKNRFGKVYAFYRILRQIVSRPVDAAFVCQGGAYPLLLMPMKMFRGTPIFHWKAHAQSSRSDRFYARFCDDVLFTATPSSFPGAEKKKIVVGHGIDTALFSPDAKAERSGLVAVGRIGPSKKIDQMIKVVARLESEFGLKARLDLIGPVLPPDNAYADSLKREIDRNGLQDRIRFKDVLPRKSLPAVLARYRAMLNFSTTALDKSVLEAMACGVPVLSENPCVKEILPDHLVPELFAERDNTGMQASMARRLLLSDPDSYEKLSRDCRGVVVRGHDIKELFGRITSEMTARIS